MNVVQQISEYDKELFNKIINMEDEDNENDSHNDVCLITNMKLEDNYIELDCRHKFNYIPLYNEIMYQKTRKVLDNTKLRFNEIRCPYCRNVTSKLLPYYKYYPVKAIRGVNYPNNLCMKLHDCEYLINKKTKCCGSACLTKNGYLCNKHLKLTMTDEKFLLSYDKELIDKYKNKKVNELKLILKENGCKVCGVKIELVNRILLEKTKKGEIWIEK